MVALAVLGLDQIMTQIDSVHAGMQTKIDRAVQGAGLSCQKYAKILCPVDTGRLRSSIQYVNVGTYKCMVNTDVFYAIFVELGHATRGGGGYVPPRPFMTPAYEQAKRELLEKLRAINWS